MKRLYPTPSKKTRDMVKEALALQARAMTATPEQLLEIERRATELMKGYSKLIGGVKAK